MRNNDSQITKDLKLSSDDWFIINLHQTGYYRVNYDNDNWKMIIQHLQDNETYQQITASNRAQLIDDSMNLARAGYINYSIPLDVTTYLKHETDYVPWKAALNSFSFIDSMLIRTANYELFRVRNWLKGRGWGQFYFINYDHFHSSCISLISWMAFINKLDSLKVIMIPCCRFISDLKYYRLSAIWARRSV